MDHHQGSREAERKIQHALLLGAPILDLSFHQLTALPESVSKLRKLRLLDLTGNHLASLPESLAQLKNLQILVLCSNQLTALPWSLGQLTELKYLILFCNKITELPDCIGQLTKLESLELYNNRLRALPESLGNLKLISTLNIAQNELVSLPNSLGQLPQLATLNVSYNRLEVLSDSLAELKKLNTLNISCNQLTSLPDSLGRLGKLPALDASCNRLTDLPPSFSQIQGLTGLNLSGNPLNPELAAAYAEGLDTVRAYLRAKAKAVVTLNETKLILIGEGEVGKTCLIGALRGDPWEEGRPTTHGIEIKTFKVAHPSRKTDITLNAWDFGGQRVYRPTHQLFFTAQAVYLVVWKPREGSQQGLVKEWIKLVRHRESDAKILVVATHGGPKDRQPDIDRQEIWDLFGKETVIDFFHVDSRPPNLNPVNGKWSGPCRGIKELKEGIAHVAAALPEMWVGGQACNIAI